MQSLKICNKKSFISNILDQTEKIQIEDIKPKNKDPFSPSKILSQDQSVYVLDNNSAEEIIHKKIKK